jgi:hypothetical protein
LGTIYFSLSSFCIKSITKSEFCHLKISLNALRYFSGNYWKITAPKQGVNQGKEDEVTRRPQGPRKEKGSPTVTGRESQGNSCSTCLGQNPSKVEQNDGRVLERYYQRESETVRTNSVFEHAGSLAKVID